MIPSPAIIRSLYQNERFVFGSNTKGIHGAGAARRAFLFFGAEWRVGSGPTGQCYAIKTKDSNLQTLPLDQIARHVDTFILYALAHPELVFLVTAIGCGLAGYTPEQIAPMFKGAPENVRLPQSFIDVLTRHDPDSLRSPSTGTQG